MSLIASGCVRDKPTPAPTAVAGCAQRLNPILRYNQGALRWPILSSGDHISTFTVIVMAAFPIALIVAMILHTYIVQRTREDMKRRFIDALRKQSLTITKPRPNTLH